MLKPILDFLDVSELTLDSLVAAYVRRVPWESVSRIARRRPAWPDDFWSSAMQQGTGGTCFESNLAFFDLLRGLGHTGYLTINDMGETQGCHSAIVLQDGSGKTLVDVGLPLYATLPLDPNHITHATSPFHTFSAVPLGDNRYEIRRDRHPNPYCFTLIDCPVDEDTYRTVLRNDYGPDGLFLDRAIIHKVINERVWRFDGTQPYHLKSFDQGEKTYYLLDQDAATVARQLADHFGIAYQLVLKALC
jgi:arylamine N-acetyltransferase